MSLIGNEVFDFDFLSDFVPMGIGSRYFQKNKFKRCPQTGKNYQKRTKTPVRDLHREDKMLSGMINQETANFSQYRAAAQQKADTLVRTLQMNGLTVAQPVIAGSIGKRTSLGSGHHPDIDVVLLLPEPDDTTFDGIKKYLQASLDKVDDILQENGDYRFSRPTPIASKYESDIKVEERSYKLKMDIVTGIKFKLPDQTRTSDKKDLLRAQWESVLKYMSPDSYDEQKFLSGSLAQVSTAFSKYQHDFVLRFVTLVRIWCRKNFEKGTSFNGRATAFELIAIRAALNELKRSKMSESRRPLLPLALEQFFLQMNKPLNEIRVRFEVDEYPENLQPVPDIVRRALQESSVKYPYGKAMLLDPVNPCHNFLTDSTLESRYESYRRKAAWSYNMLQKHKKRSKEMDPDMSILLKMMEGEVVKPAM